jgi:hypothetical protein
MALSQSHYRFGIAELAESTHGWKAAEDKPIMLPPGEPFLLRFCVQADATGQSNVDSEFQFRQLRSDVEIFGWTNITTSSAVVRTGATAVFTNGQNCTKRLSGTGTFESSGAGCTHDGTSGGSANDIAANGNSETEIGLQILGADTAVGDVIEFRLTRDGGTLLNSYAVTPSIRVGVEILAAQSRDTSLHTSISAGVTKISGTVVQVQGKGMSAVDLADTTLEITMNVWGTTVVGSTDPADYTVHLQGPDVWSGGQIGKPGTSLGGMSIPPGFSFARDMPEGVRRVLATFQPNKTVTFGADASLVEAA